MGAVGTRRAPLAAALALALGSGAGSAGEADVLAARADCRGEICDFQVTLRHADTGWDHYADRFEIVGPDDAVLGTRVLRHPHVDEQPFTRGLRGLRVPEALKRVRVRAGDSQHGLGGAEVEIELPRGGG